MANQVDNFVSNIGKQPVFSGLCALASIGSTAGIALSESFGVAAFGTAFVSPVIVPLLAASAAINLFRERSGLSKIFSAAAIGGAAVAMAGYAATIGAPGWDALGAYAYSMVGMAGVSLLNIVAHYTRNKNVKITATTEDITADVQNTEAGKAPGNDPAP